MYLTYCKPGKVDNGEEESDGFAITTRIRSEYALRFEDKYTAEVVASILKKADIFPKLDFKAVWCLSSCCVIKKDKKTQKNS